MGLEINNSILEIKASSKNKNQEDLFSLLQNKNFQETMDILQGQVDNYTKLEDEAEESRKELFQSFKNKKITSEEYTEQVKNLLPWNVWENPKHPLEKKIRELKVQQDIADIVQPNILYDKNQLGENISDGGSNTLGVFVIDKDIVARCSLHGYDDASRLLLYKDRIQSPVIKKTLQVTEIGGKVYQVQERAYGKSTINLTQQQLKSIAVEHYRAFRNAIQEMKTLGLSLDISGGKSNVFYDPENGFSIIDLGIGEIPSDNLIEDTLFKRE